MRGYMIKLRNLCDGKGGKPAGNCWFFDALEVYITDDARNIKRKLLPYMELIVVFKMI